jgi:peptidyl-prolyl cis-trans isomerase SurA
MISIKKVSILTFIVAAFALPAFAQETQTRVVDEVVAQVNDGVITLSRIKREIKDIIDSEVQQGKKREDVQKVMDEKEGELIANLINEELLVQKAKEMGLDKDIDAAINQRMGELMKQYNLKTVEALYIEMQKSGVDPEDFKSGVRKQMTRDRVIQQEIQAKIYWSFNGKELKDYYEAHKEKFTKQETIGISELFLGFAGRNEADVRTKAKDLYALLRNGSDWDKIVKENSDPGVVTQGTGKAEKLKVADLAEVVATPLKGLPVHSYTQPFEAEQLGMIILRIDNREAASNESVFDENAVRMALLNERAPAEQKKFFTKLRAEAYIKISETYRPIVSPILYADERKEKTNN